MNSWSRFTASSPRTTGTTSIKLSAKIDVEVAKYAPKRETRLIYLPIKRARFRVRKIKGLQGTFLKSELRSEAVTFHGVEDPPEN
jgi:hypothetical protein